MDRAGGILIYGYGNPGRLDDGLGPALISALEGSLPPGIQTEANYQLALEDAAAVAASEVVLFVDASVSGPVPFSLALVVPEKGRVGFTTHSLSVGALVGLAEELSGASAVAYLLGIRGYEFNEYDERFSPDAARNLSAAIEFVRTGLQAENFAAYLDGHLTSPNSQPPSSLAQERT